MGENMGEIEKPERRRTMPERKTKSQTWGGGAE